MKIWIKNIYSLDTSCLKNERCPEYVEAERWEKIKIIKAENDKLRSLASGYLLQKMCEESGIKNPHYKYGEKGKPYIENGEHIRFNLSHSGDYAALVFTDGARTKMNEVGMDIQKIRVLRDSMKMRILHKNEQIPEGLTEEEETEYLNQIWCIKESYVKMTGKGLLEDFRKIYVDFEKGTVLGTDGKTGYYKKYSGLKGYVLSVCACEPFCFDFTVDMDEV